MSFEYNPNVHGGLGQMGAGGSQVSYGILTYLENKFTYAPPLPLEGNAPLGFLFKTHRAFNLSAHNANGLFAKLAASLGLFKQGQLGPLAHSSVHEHMTGGLEAPSTPHIGGGGSHEIG